MFVFNRSIWTVAAGLGTALTLVIAARVLDGGVSIQPPPTPAAAIALAANKPPDTTSVAR
jgi:hypothetical protein